MNSLTILLLVSGGLFIALLTAIGVQRGDRPLQIVKQTLMGWPPVFLGLSNVFPVLQVPVIVVMVLFMLWMMWWGVRKIWKGDE